MNILLIINDPIKSPGEKEISHYFINFLCPHQFLRASKVRKSAGFMLSRYGQRGQVLHTLGYLFLEVDSRMLLNS